MADKCKIESIENRLNCSACQETQKDILKRNFFKYLVLFAAFIAYMLSTMLSSCFGVFFDNIQKELQLTKSKVAFIGALLSSFGYLLGPIASLLINLYGCKKMTIIGGFLTSFGIIASAYTTNYWLYGLLIGVVSGFGNAIVAVSTIVIVASYFQNRISFATGFVISGGSLGTTIFPLCITSLNEIYGHSGSFLILGAIVLNIVVCGALFEPTEQAFQVSNKVVNIEKQPIDKLDDQNSQLNNSQNYPTFNSLNRCLLCTNNLKSNSVLNFKTTQDDEKNCKKILNIHILSNSCPNIATNENKSTIIQYEQPESKNEEKSKEIIEFKLKQQEIDVKSVIVSDSKLKFSDQIKCNYDNLLVSIDESLKLFHNFEFIILIICNFILCLFYESSFYFINSYLIEHGYSEKQAAIVTIATGIAGIFASIAYGLLGDFKCVNWTFVYSISLIMTALSNFAVPIFITNYLLTIIFMVLMSTFISATDVLVPTICSHIVGNENFINAYGLIFLTHGIACLIGPPLLGNNTLCMHKHARL